jgi:hypothetical protein
MQEYMSKKMSAEDYFRELGKLVVQYNAHQGSYLFVYATAMNKGIPLAMLEQSDYYMIHDMLADPAYGTKVDMYLETPGGKGETAEDIVRFLRDRFDAVSFVISGEAKSAGTIMALSGDNILMTETGSLGPIDAQVKVGRSICSAYDYIEWMDGKRIEAEKNQALNPLDATMIAQITPGEYAGIHNSLKFAEDLVCEWLTNYKFKNWNVTETRRNAVTEEIKRERAREIAEVLTNHSRWRSHGRSIKRQDLEKIGLKIDHVENDAKLKDIVYRIQTVCRLIFEGTTVFKIFATANAINIRNAAAPPTHKAQPQAKADVFEVEQQCPQCGRNHKLYGKFRKDHGIDREFQKRGSRPFPKDSQLRCQCGYTIDLSGVRNEVELTTKQKLL